MSPSAFLLCSGSVCSDAKPKICSFLHPRELIRGLKSRSERDSHKLAGSQLGSVTLLKDLLFPLSYTFATLLKKGSKLVYISMLAESNLRYNT